MKNPLVLISVLNWNGGEKTVKCLRSLHRLKYLNYKIVVTDNASADDSLTLIRSSFPKIPIIENDKNEGYAGGHYKALDYAKELDAQLLWVLNNDLLVAENSLSQLILHYVGCPGHIYGAVPFGDGLPQPMTIWPIKGGMADFDNELDIELFYSNDENKKPLINYVELANIHGSCMLVPLNVIARHGFLDRSFFMYAEEIDLCLRMLGAGVTSHLVLSSLVIHESKGSSSSNSKLTRILSYYQRRNYLVVLRRHRSLSYYFKLQKTYFKEFTLTLIKGERIDRYKLLGCFHALFGVMGKRLNFDKLS